MPEHRPTSAFRIGTAKEYLKTLFNMWLSLAAEQEPDAVEQRDLAAPK
jgi:hypothetical protein